MTKIINGVASEFEFPADTGVFTQNVFEKENEILRKNAEHNDKVVDKVNWENMLLKKENQELKEQNKKEFADYIKFKKEQLDEYLEKINKLIKEKQELKKQLEDANEKIILLQASEPMLNYKKALEETQQKEFIKYLEDEIQQQETVIAENQEKSYFLIYEDEKEYLKLSSQKAYIRRIILEEVLQKYKEIIGVSDENNIK